MKKASAAKASLKSRVNMLFFFPDKLDGSPEGVRRELLKYRAMSQGLRGTLSSGKQCSQINVFRSPP